MHNQSTFTPSFIDSPFSHSGYLETQMASHEVDGLVESISNTYPCHIPSIPSRYGHPYGGMVIIHPQPHGIFFHTLWTSKPP
jgi:hypothetical protein